MKLISLASIYGVKRVCRRCRYNRIISRSAGASAPGGLFTARHTDAVFQVAPNVQAMRSNSDDIRLQVANAGRQGSQIKIVFGPQTVVAEPHIRCSQVCPTMAVLSQI